LLLEQYYKKSQATIKFWRTTDGAEVDLIIEKNNSILPVEIKYITMKKPDIPK